MELLLHRSPSDPVFVCWGAMTRRHRLGPTAHVCLSEFWRLGVWDQGVGQGWFLLRPVSWLADSCLPAVLPHCLFCVHVSLVSLTLLRRNPFGLWSLP